MTIILGLIIGISEFDLFVRISDLTMLLHNQCLKFTPESFIPEIYASLVCGKKLPTSELSQNLKNLGIYHVIIVSGSHLIFLSLLVEKIFTSTRLSKLKFFTLPLLIVYALATGAEPPVVRALFSIIIDTLQKKRKLFWNQNEVIFISLLVSLALFDPWRKSYSLLLSYVASVALSLTAKKQHLLKNLGIYFLIFPFLLPLSAPSPVSFITNMLLAPLVGFVLFPLSFLAFIIPYFYLLVDPFWKAFLFLCSVVGPELSPLEKVSYSISYMWMMAIFLNLYGIYREKRLRSL